MMHDAGGTAWMSWAMWLVLLVPLLALGLAVYLLVRVRGLAAPTKAEAEARAEGASPAAAGPLDASARRLLDDDERRLYDIVLERQGDVAQGDLVALSGFSKAKVSRVIDRLEAKGLVVRVRRGMGNRVLLTETR